ncbi:hypothetical protein TNIN_261221 [Trichonephila inaurata madagascariensis]|uniref:Mos1 transposase HTH domain-containing protein n=1 Tax=Trichonephila inaurata madagascariensis TaxID=2747483 RepID=A0A8X6ICI7_9ARAC|nr:hypothetical protein TNIN_261221 [Trichonephila inaurata madagascariensis]
MPVGALETLKDVKEQYDLQIVIQRDFWLGHSTAATVAKVNKVWGVGTTSEWIVRRLFAKFHSGDMDIDHKSRADLPVQCNVDIYSSKSRTNQLQRYDS